MQITRCVCKRCPWRFLKCDFVEIVRIQYVVETVAIFFEAKARDPCTADLAAIVLSNIKIWMFFELFTNAYLSQHVILDYRIIVIAEKTWTLDVKIIIL